jgi:hypothetical protein
VADSVALLLDYPPELAAWEIQSWTSAQFRGRKATVPVSDYLFHALEKIHMMGTYELVPRDSLARYLEDLAQIVLGFCPEEDRELLLSNLSRLGQSSSVLAQPVEVLHRQIGSASPLASEKRESAERPMPDDMMRQLKRFTMLVERFEQQLAPAAGKQVRDRQGEKTDERTDEKTDGKKTALASQLISAAARSARTDRDFSKALEQLRRLGIEVQTADLFRTLGKAIPAWGVSLPPDSMDRSASIAGASSVIRKIITLPEDPVEVGRRFHEMVQAAVEQLNSGSLARAAKMFAVAERLITENRVDPNSVDASRRKALESIDFENIRKTSEDPATHALLRKILSFFPTLTPAGILNELQIEEKRERRRLLLSLLEVHGESVRPLVFERLQTSLQSGPADDEWHFKRNLLYLLRRIPRQADLPWDEEIDALIRLSDPVLPSPLVKEAIANLGQVKHEKAEATLVARVEGLEQMLMNKGDAPFDQAELQPLLERAVAVLARFGTPSARRVVVEHGLRKKTPLGDDAARLADLAGQDLSEDPDLVNLLVKSLRAELPFKILGFTLKKNEEKVLNLVEALSATPLPQVRRVFDEIVERFPAKEFGKTAQKALTALEAPRVEEAHAALSGDLEIFELPSLLQSLGVSEVTGILTLRDQRNEVHATMTLERGKIRGCQVGVLRGDDACYQLFERPIPGTFAFTKNIDLPPRKESDPPPREVVPVLLEGMRRYDEFQRASALVPDDMQLVSTDVKPTANADEPDAALQQAVWARIVSGAPPRLCEQTVGVDAFRIRRLLVYWLEEGSLGPAA